MNSKIIPSNNSKLIEYPNNTKNIIGIIFVGNKVNKIKNKNKILLNFTKIYLSKNKQIYSIEKDNINIYSYIKTNFKINKKNIISVNKITRKNNKNYQLYIVNVNFNTEIDSLIEHTYTDFYTYQENQDLYENIIQQKNGIKNKHIEECLTINNTNNEYTIYLKKIYLMLIDTIKI